MSKKTPSPIRHARIAVIIIGLGALVLFIIRCIQTNFFEEIDIIIAGPVITQLLLWLGLFVSYKRPFIGLIVPTALFVLISLYVLNNSVKWDFSAEFLGNCTGLFLFNFFTVRGCVYAIKHYGITGRISPQYKS